MAQEVNKGFYLGNIGLKIFSNNQSVSSGTDIEKRVR